MNRIAITLRNTLRAGSVFLASLFLAGCGADEGKIPEGGWDRREKTAAVFRLTQEDFGLSKGPTEAGTGLAFSLGTGRTLTRSAELTEQEEFAVEHLSILQFDEEGLLIGKFRVDDPGEYRTEEGDAYEIEAELYESESYTLFFLANVDDPAVSNLAEGEATLADFQEITVQYSTQEEPVAGGRIPMTAYFEGTPVDETIPVSLKRLPAKVRLTYSYREQTADGGTLELTSVRLKNVPVGTTYWNFRNEEPDYLYPEASQAGAFRDYDPEPIQGTSGTFVWYMPENLRGTIDNDDPKTKSRHSAPAMSTCIEFRGRYLLSGKTYDVVLSVYPGANETNDFDLHRNGFYDVKVTIDNLDFDDERIDPEVVKVKVTFWTRTEEGDAFYFEQDLDKGDPLEYPQEPEIEGYELDRIEPDIAEGTPLEQDLDIYYVFKQRMVTIYWINERDSDLNETMEIPWGGTVEYVVIPPDVIGSYKFWHYRLNDEIITSADEIAGRKFYEDTYILMEYTYNSVAPPPPSSTQYTVRFWSSLGFPVYKHELIREIKVEAGTVPALPAAPHIDGYVYEYCYPNLTPASSDKDYYLVYEPEEDILDG